MSEPTKFERIQQLPRYTLFLLLWQCGCGLRSPICPFRGSLLHATQFQHGFSKPYITNKSIVNVQESFLLTLLLELICSVVFSITFFLSVLVTVWSALPDVKVRIEKRSRTDLMYFLFSVVSSRKKCPHVQQTMPASQYARHALHCAFGSTSSISHNSVFPAALITFCDSSLKGLNGRCC